MRPLLTIDRPSEVPAWESAWYPGEAPGESGGSWLTFFLSLSLLSLEDALFLLCPWFSLQGFYTFMSFNEASEDLGFHCHFSFLTVILYCSSIRGEVSDI